MSINSVDLTKVYANTGATTTTATTTNDVESANNELLLAMAAEEDDEAAGLDSLNLTNQTTATTTATTDTTATSAATAATEALTTSSVPTDEEIEAMETKKEANEATIAQLQTQVEQLVEEVKAEIAAAIAEQEDIQDEQKEEVENIVATKLQEYENSNGEMTIDEFRAGVATSIATSNSAATRALEGCVSNILAANQKLNLVDALLTNINSLVQENETLEQQIADAKAAQQAAAAAAAANSAKSGCCDPISFNLDGAQYDFIVDDGAFDSASDFLGANNYFEAMQNLDADGDGKVTKNELEAGNIKLVKTENGAQSVVDVSSVFDDDDFVDLSTYSDTNSVTSAQSQIANGTDSVTLGTFSLTLGAENETVAGRSTLDSTEFLNETYGFGTEGTTANEYTNFLEEYSAIAAELRAELAQTSAGIGITSTQLDAISAQSKAEANAQAVQIANDIKTVETQKIEERKAQEAKAATAADATNNATATQSASGTAAATNATHEVQELTDDNIDSLRDDQGTSYVYVYGPKCSRCKNFGPEYQEACQNIDNANFYSINGSESNSLMWSLIREGGVSGSIVYPAVIRCENGQAVEVLEKDEIYGKKNLTEILQNKVS